MKKRSITWLWENEVAQELFAEWVQFPEPSQTAQEIDSITKLLNLKPPMRILDVGCGTGRHVIELAQRGYRVTGIDVATKYLSQARLEAERHNLDITFRLQRGSELTDEQVYDSVLAINHTPGFLSSEEMTQHFHRIRAALKRGCKLLLLLAGPKITPSTTSEKVKSWAERNGRYILSEKYIQNKYRHENGVIIDTIQDEIIEYHEKQMAFSLEDMRSQLQAVGFSDIRCLQNLDGATATASSFGVFIAKA